jgi:DNA phosphorothioation-associated putative methyltransferase
MAAGSVKNMHDPADTTWATLQNTYNTIVGLISGGKRVADHSYLHLSLVSEHDETLRGAVSMAAALAGVNEAAFDVVRFGRRTREIALLAYPTFFEAPFPALACSWRLDIDRGEVQRTDFSDRANPPILHRKELLLPEEHPRRGEFEALTVALEDYGAFDRPSWLIGTKSAWSAVLEDLGLNIINGHVLVAERPPGSPLIQRHRTAIARSKLSAPMQVLAKWGLLQDATVLDYGCGRGDDVRALVHAGIPAVGWDPHYAPEAPRQPADIVNLGFVLNVIEDPSARRLALEEAYSLAGRLLSVAVMLEGKGTGRAHGDGVVTKRATFQKYFSQAELIRYVADLLGREPISVAPGVLFVFRDDEREQTFLARKQRSSALNRDALDLAFPSEPRSVATLKERRRKVAEPKPSDYEANRNLLDTWWATCLDLGRVPEPDEFEKHASLVEAFHSVKRAFAALPYPDRDTRLTETAERRRDDVTVYLALNLFERRRSMTTLPIPVQRDIKAFLGSHKAAMDHARKALFAVGSSERIVESIEQSAKDGLGVKATDGDYTFHVDNLTRQPPPIRIMIGCAERLEQMPTDVDLIKIHPAEGRVSFLMFDDFAGKPLPRLTKRLSVDLRKLRVHETASEPPEDCRLLFGKSHFVRSDFPRYDTQARFDNRIKAAGGYVAEGLGASHAILMSRLIAAGIKLNGYKILRIK